MSFRIHNELLSASSRQEERARKAEAAGLKLITDAEMASLEACWTGEDWSRACDAIKAAHGGFYPEDWFLKVNMSGMMSRITSRWN